MLLPNLLNILPIEFIIIGSILIMSLIIGLSIERWLYPRLKKGAAKRRRNNPRIIIRMLQGETILWLIIAAIYTVVEINPLEFSQSIQSSIFTILWIILIITFAYFLIRTGVRFIEYYTRRGTLPKTSIFPNLIRIIIISLASVAILRILDYDIGPLLAAFGVGGIAIALALQDTLANLFSGIAILTAGQINPGDYVKLDGGNEGWVEDVSWRNTTIKSIEDAMIIIPNKHLGELIVTNYSLPVTEINLRIPVGVSYESDLKKVEQVTIEVAKEIMNNVKGGVPNFDPYIRYNEFGDSSINFKAVLRVKSYQDMRLLRHKFIMQLHDRFNKEGINIPFPIRTLYLKQPHSEEGNGPVGMEEEVSNLRQ